MNKIINLASNFLRDEQGLTMVEYAIAGALIAAAAATGFGTLGGAVGTRADTLAITVASDG